MLRILFRLIAVLSLVCSTSIAIAYTDPRQSMDRVELARTCTHYVNRARFMERTANAPLEVLVADSCAFALKRLTTSFGISPYEAKRARIYLERLTEYKALIIAMNVKGFSKHRKVRLTGQRRPAFGLAPSKVSRAGEYLIARQMGLLEAYNDWASAANYETVVAGLSR